MLRPKVGGGLGQVVDVNYSEVVRSQPFGPTISTGRNGTTSRSIVPTATRDKVTSMNVMLAKKLISLFPC